MAIRQTHTIGVIAGDGIGREVIPAGVAAIEKATRGGAVSVSFTELPWGCEYYLQHQRMMDEDGFDRLSTFDAIYLGALGAPAVSDGVSAGLILAIRQRFDQYVNLRPMRLLPGCACARIPKASIPARAVASIAARRTKWRSKPPCSRGTGSSAFCVTASSSPRNGRGQRSPAPRSRTRSRIRW